MNINNCEFLRSAAGKAGFPRDGLPQIVMAGRSNVGKSSVINTLVRRKAMARISGTPGKTANINLYLIDKTLYLVDLPGYGYASVSHGDRKRWGALMDEYFSEPADNRLGVLIVDSRHPPTKDDATMSKFFTDTGHTFVVLANKTDKLRRPSDLDSDVIRTILGCGSETPIIPFSAKNGTGRDELLAAIRDTFSISPT